MALEKMLLAKRVVKNGDESGGDACDDDYHDEDDEDDDGDGDGAS